MGEYTVKVNKNYGFDPEKVIDECRRHPLLTNKDPDMEFFPSYKGIKGNYHRFCAPTSFSLGVLVSYIALYAMLDDSDLAKKVCQDKSIKLSIESRKNK